MLSQQPRRHAVLFAALTGLLALLPFTTASAAAQGRPARECVVRDARPIVVEAEVDERVIVRFDASCAATFERTLIPSDVFTAQDTITDCYAKQWHNDAVDIDLTWSKLQHKYAWNGASITATYVKSTSVYAAPDGWQNNSRNTTTRPGGYWTYIDSTATFEFSPFSEPPRWVHALKITQTASPQGTCRATFSHTGSLVPGGYLCTYV